MKRSQCKPGKTVPLLRRLQRHALGRLLSRSFLFLCCAGFGLPFGMEGCIPTDPTPDPDPNPSVRLWQAMMKYPTGEEPFVAITNDCNGDALIDIIVANRAADTVSILLAKSEGGYAEHVDYPVGDGPSALVSEDLDGDLIPDLLVANYYASDLSFLRGKSDGALESAVQIPLTENAAPLAMDLGDINGDGVLDLALANYGLSVLSTFLGNGDGSFSAASDWSVGDNPRSVQLVDLNGDSNLDLLCANRNTHDISLLYGRGDGVFESALHMPTGEAPRMAIAQDINRDSLPDIAVSNTGSQDISVFIALPTGGYAAEVRYALDFVPTRMVAEDFTGDGIPELAALLYSVAEAPEPLGITRVLINNGNGEFLSSRSFGSGRKARDLFSSDIDGDGRQDLLTADSSEDQVSICFGKADGSFETDERFAVGEHPRMVLVEDFTGDHKLDALVNNLEDNSLSLLAGYGDGSFAPAERIQVSDIPRAIASADINEDGDPDIVATNLSTSHVSLFLNRGDGSFEAEKRFLCKEADEIKSAYPRSVAIGDVNADNHLDIVTGNSSLDGLGILLGDGAGNFSSAQAPFIANYPLAVHIADINRDGKRDYICLSTSDPSDGDDGAQPRVVRSLNIGDGSYVKDTIKRYTTGGSPRDLALGDLNNDGNLDAVSVHPGDDSVYVLQGGGDGSFTGADRKRTSVGPNSVHLAHVNDDNYRDILTCTPNGIVGVLLGRGGLAFLSPFSLFVGDGSYGAITADVDEDGKPDVLLVNQSSNDLSVLLGAP